MVALRDKQREALDPLRSRWVHGDPPGSGKTPVGWTWLSEHQVATAMIVAPSGVVSHWQRQGAEWAPEFETFVVPVGTKAEKRQATYDAFGEGPLLDPRALITTYDVFRQDADRLATWTGWDAVIFDEAHRLKNRNSLVHKEAVKLARRCDLLDLSTGSPIHNKAEEAWSMLRLLYPQDYSSFWKWAQERFWIDVTDFGGRSPRPVRLIGDPKDGALEQIAEEFGKHLVSRPEEVMLPHIAEHAEIGYEVALSAEERKAYDSMKKRYWMEHGGEVVFAPNEVSKMTRLRQMASDWSSLVGESLDEGTKVKFFGGELLDAVGANKAVIFVNFQHTAGNLEVCLPNAATYHGGMHGDDRERSLDRFITGDAQFLIGTYEAMGEGIDGLQHAAHHVVLYDQHWLPEAERQAIRRLQRDGQTKQVVVHRLTATDTIDELIAKSRAAKKEVADIITGRDLTSVLGT